jgi:hypothetical protein
MSAPVVELAPVRAILTIADLCDLLRISESQFYELKDELGTLGLLVPVYPDLDRKRRYLGAPLVAWLSNKRQADLLRRTLERVR